MGIKPVDPFLYFGIFAGFLPLLADFPYKYYTKGADVKRIGQYVRNWWRWVNTGVEVCVENKVRRYEGSSLNTFP